MKMKNECVTFVSSKKFETCGNEALGGAAFPERLLFSAPAVLRGEKLIMNADVFLLGRVSEVRIGKARFLGFISGSLIGEIWEKSPFFKVFGPFGRENLGVDGGFLPGKRERQFSTPTLLNPAPADPPNPSKRG